MEDMAGSSGRYRVEEMAAAKEVDFEAPPPALSHSSSGDSLASLSSSSSEDDAFGPRTPRVDCDVVRPIARSDTWKPDRAKFGSGKLHTGSLASPNLPHAAAGNGSAAGLPGTPGATAGDKPVQGHLLSQTESAQPSRSPPPPVPCAPGTSYEEEENFERASRRMRRMSLSKSHLNMLAAKKRVITQANIAGSIFTQAKGTRLILGEETEIGQPAKNAMSDGRASFRHSRAELRWPCCCCRGEVIDGEGIFRRWWDVSQVVLLVYVAIVVRPDNPRHLAGRVPCRPYMYGGYIPHGGFILCSNTAC